jgi:hypothetical protein
MAAAIIAGALANKPWRGGNAWSRLSFISGLRRLGFDVLFLEQISAPSGEARTYFRLVCDQFSLDGALLTDAAPPRELLERVESAAFLVNIGGHLTVPAVLRAARRKIFLDDDPGYTQMWHAQGLLGQRLAGHDAYFTVGLNVGRTGCPIPVGGIDWRPIMPPVVLDDWPPAATGRLRGFTTVASWRGDYGRLAHAGGAYGQKAHEFRKVVELPAHTRATFEIALDIHPADAVDRTLLETNGWRLVDPREAAGTPDAFRSYVRASDAEFSVARGAYVGTRSGWFSDRTAKYLASGRPALVQDTDLANTLPVGEGLVTFRSLPDAVTSVERIRANYEAHSQAARAIAEEHLDSDRVLARMLDWMT